MPPRRPAALTLAAAVAAGGCSFGSPKPTPRPSPTPGVQAQAAELRTLPEAPPPLRQAVAAELAVLLQNVYERGFLAPLPPPRVKGKRASPRPTPVPRPPLGELFTDPARAALSADDAAFRPGPGAVVRGGVVRFTGTATLEGESATGALLSVEFTADGTLTEGAETRRMRLKQTGELLVVRTEQGWRVGGFDVQLTAERQVIAPSASPVAAKWMPPVPARTMP